MGNLDPLEGDIHQQEGNLVKEDNHQGLRGDTLQQAGNLGQEEGNQLSGDILHLEGEDNHPKKEQHTMLQVYSGAQKHHHF